jgi:hypothetical protein
MRLDSRRCPSPFLTPLLCALPDLKAVLAVVGWRGPVDRTVVAGKTVMQDGHLLGIDEKRAAAEANACWRRFVGKNA